MLIFTWERAKKKECVLMYIVLCSVSHMHLYSSRFPPVFSFKYMKHPFFDGNFGGMYNGTAKYLQCGRTFELEDRVYEINLFSMHCSQLKNIIYSFRY